MVLYREGRSVPTLATVLVVLVLALLACSQPAASGSAPAPAPVPTSAAPEARAGQPPAASGPPVEIRIGHGFAGEENLWLMAAKPDVTPNQGQAYRLAFTAFRGNTDRLNAYEAGQLDGGTIAGPTALFAAEQGVPLKLVASIVRDRQGSDTTSYLALGESGIRSASDVRGKTVGIVDFKSATELWARAAIEAAGLNPDRDVSFVVVPFPGMGEAVRFRRIDVGAFPEPFRTAEQQRGGIVEAWTSKTGVPFEEELLDLFLQPDFIANHREATRAFLADFVATTRWYLDHQPEARQLLIDKGFVQTPPELYLNLKDYYREPSGRVTLDGFAQIQELHLKMGWQTRKLNINDVVDMSLLPQ